MQENEIINERPEEHAEDGASDSQEESKVQIDFWLTSRDRIRGSNLVSHKKKSKHRAKRSISTIDPYSKTMVNRNDTYDENSLVGS